MSYKNTPESMETIELMDNDKLAKRFAEAIIANGAKRKEIAEIIKKSLENASATPKQKENLKRWIHTNTRLFLVSLENRMTPPTNEQIMHNLKKVGEDVDDFFVARDEVIEDIMDILDNKSATETAQFSDPETKKKRNPNNVAFYDLNFRKPFEERLETLKNKIKDYDKKTYPPVNEWREELEFIRKNINSKALAHDRAATLAHIARVDAMINAKASYDPGGKIRNDPRYGWIKLHELGHTGVTSVISGLGLVDKDGKLRLAPPGTKHVNDVPRNGAALVLRGAGLAAFGILFTLSAIITGRKIFSKEKLGLSDGLTLAYGFAAAKLAGVLPGAKAEYENAQKILALADEDKKEFEGFRRAVRKMGGREIAVEVAEDLHDKLKESDTKKILRNIINSRKKIGTEHLKKIAGETDPIFLAAEKCKSEKEKKDFRQFLYELMYLDIHKDDQMARIRITLEEYM